MKYIQTGIKTILNISLLLTILLVLSSNKSALATVNTATVPGDWSTDGIWSLGHAPQAGEDIDIPANITVTLTAPVIITHNFAAIERSFILNGDLILNGNNFYFESQSATTAITFVCNGNINGTGGESVSFVSGHNIFIRGSGNISNVYELSVYNKNSKAVIIGGYINTSCNNQYYADAVQTNLTITGNINFLMGSSFCKYHNYGNLTVNNGNVTFLTDGGGAAANAYPYLYNYPFAGLIVNSGNIEFSSDYDYGVLMHRVENAGEIEINGDLLLTTKQLTSTTLFNNGSYYGIDSTCSTSGISYHHPAVFTVNGNILGNSSSGLTNRTNITNYENSIINVSGALLPIGSGSPAYGILSTNSTNNTINYTGGIGQVIKSPSASIYWNLKCSNDSVKTLESSIIVKGDLTIQDSAALDVSASSFGIDIKGNWVNTSTNANPFVERTGTVTFSGDSTQTITAGYVPGGETFHKLITNNRDTGIVLNSNIKVTDTLTLTDGLLHTGVDTVWVSNSDTAAIQGYSDTTYVNGYLKRSISPTTDSSYDFPVGNAGAYSLANVKFFGSNTVGSITTDFSNPDGGSTLTSLTDANDAVYDNLLNCGGSTIGTGDINAGVWNIRPGKGSAIYDLSLYGRHFDNHGTMYHSIVKRGSTLLPWEFAGTYLPAELKTDTLIARRTCLTDFYQFAIAASNTNTPLNSTPLSFKSLDSMICGGKCTAFISKNNFSATAWRWTRSGGAFSNAIDTALQNPSGICFNDLGNYDVRLIASTACHADTLEKKQYVRVNPIPTAAITAPDSICSGVTAHLSASPTGTDITYLWSTTATTTAISVAPLSTTTYSLIVSTAYCGDTAFVTIAVTTTPTASVNANTTAICSGESISLVSTGIAEAYLWNTGESGTSITASPLFPIRYWLRLNNRTCSHTDSISISVTTTPTATITTEETSICSGKRIILSAASIPEVTYLWNNATTSQNINAIPLTNTTYSVVLTNGVCKDSANISITVTTSPTLTLTSNQTIVCSGESATMSATGAGDYLWSTGESGTSITASPLLPIRYSLKLSNGSCSDTDSIFINVVPMPTASISGPLTVCSGNSATLTASAGGGGASAYLWSTGVTSADINITPLINTGYSVTVSNGNGLCTDTTSRSIILITPIPADAGPDITMAIGLDTVLSANNGSAWSWAPKVRMDCNTCQNPIVAPFQTTSYTVTVTDINGCISSDSIKVYVIPCAELFIPKAFSPNNDGQNDVLYIRGTDCIDKINAFTIFNRWGEKVFETFDIKAGWDGSQTKEALPDEVFIYYLDALSINGDAISKTGNITLMR